MGQYEDAVSVDNPSSWWKLDDATTTAVDSQGVQNGTYTGTVTRGSASIVYGTDTPTSAYFGGGRATFADVYDLVSVAFSLEFWVQPDLAINPTSYRRIVSKETTGTNAPGWLITNQAATDVNAFKLRFERRNTASGVFNATMNPGRVVDDQIYHVVVTYDLATLVMFVNGVQVHFENNATAMENTTGVLSFMSRSDGGSPMGGRLQHVAIYDGVALSPDRILAHYEAGMWPKAIRASYATFPKVKYRQNA